MGHLLPGAVLAAKLLAVESQLAACKHQIVSRRHPLPRFGASFRFLWVALSKPLDKWEGLVHVMQPATVETWHGSLLFLSSHTPSPCDEKGQVMGPSYVAEV